MDRESEKELAKRFAAAYVSYTLGVTMSTAYKNMGSGEPGEYWLQLARRVFSEQAAAPVQAPPAEPRH